jgi:hypothetical protein
MADGASEGSCDPSAGACGQESLSKSRFGLTRGMRPVCGVMRPVCMVCGCIWQLTKAGSAADWPSEVACAPSGQ